MDDRQTGMGHLPELSPAARQDALEVHVSAVRLGAPDLVRRLALSLEPL